MYGTDGTGEDWYDVWSNLFAEHQAVKSAELEWKRRCTNYRIQVEELKCEAVNLQRKVNALVTLNDTIMAHVRAVEADHAANLKELVHLKCQLKKRGAQ